MESRVVRARCAHTAEFTIGALVQSNYTGTLQLAGVPFPAAEILGEQPAETIGNSCMIVVATDAPLDARQLNRIANRAVFAMRGTGADYAQGSGDYAISFSVVTGTPPADQYLSPAFLATMEAVEEALINSILRAETRTGFEGRTARAIPIERVRVGLQRAGVSLHNQPPQNATQNEGAIGAR